MISLGHSLLVGLVVLTSALPLAAASKAELKAFSEASLSFLNSNWERAERELGEYLERYPQSDNHAEATLLRAEARIHLKNFAGAIELLNGGRATAGGRADEYLFWLAEAQGQSGKIEVAADLYAQFTVEFPNSPRRLEAVLAEAAARSQLKQWPQVSDLLQRPAGLFQTFANTSPTLPATVRGRFLLAEALFAQGQHPAAAAALSPLAEQNLTPQSAWQRDHLLARIQLAAGHPELALAAATNLATFVTNQPALATEGMALLGRIHEALGQPDEAIAAWKNILTSAASSERQREALLRVGDLLLTQGRLGEAAQTLEAFLVTATNSPAADVAWLTLGELHLRSYVATNASPTTNEAKVAVTNLLPLAMTAFDTVLKQFPASPLVGKAHLGRGWCLALGNQAQQSGTAFQSAVNILPPSYDQAVARFKLGDALLQQKDAAGALTNYQQVAANPDGLGEVRSNLVERALCQILRAAAEAGEPSAANAAMTQLLEDFPEGTLVENALLLVGNQTSSAADPAARRAVLEGFLERSPGSRLAAGVRLAVARTYEQERNWAKAEAEYAAWLTAFPDDPARPRAEYSQALATARTGNETNALTLFTNFVVQFPTNELTSLAQWWVADYYWRAEDLVNAERNYQLLSYSQSPLRYQALLMAGRAAVARQRPEEAVSYFTNLTSDLNCESNIAAQAMFAYGDTLMTLALAETNQTLANFKHKQAITVFSKLVQLNPDTRIALLAQGKMGDCYLQLGVADPGQYSYASNAYQQVMASSLAEVPEKSQAEVGLGLVLEAQLAAGTNVTALATAALDHYLNVVYGKSHRVDEAPDPFWLKRAGIEALRLTESLQNWEQVAKLCDTLATLLPPLQPMLEKKKARALELLAKTDE